MEFSVAEIFIIAITGMTIISFLFFAFRAIKLYRDFSENISNIVLGSIIAGIGCGTIIGINALFILPTYRFIESPTTDGHYTRFVYDEHFSEHYGREYIVNLTETDYYFVAMPYGNKKVEELEESVVVLKSGYIVEIEEHVDEWFKSFPPQISSENDGDFRWHVLTEEQVQQEF
jgi:hypothetical protein